MLTWKAPTAAQIETWKSGKQATAIRAYHKHASFDLDGLTVKPRLRVVRDIFRLIDSIGSYIPVCVEASDIDRAEHRRKRWETFHKHCENMGISADGIQRLPDRIEYWSPDFEGNPTLIYSENI
jgi:hypothetical protein